ncbi:MAG: hypothetical protein CL424_03520 [Acidimicrobiaceae bacterium]|nr:hypothetical protein [Acidimicrobiaceae bacterium]
MTTWLRDHIGVVRLRQLLEDARHRLALVPLTFLFAGVVLSQVTLLIDRQLDDETLPTFFETTVDSARAILGAIAGGLITAVTLLVSMVLVAVQLASGQLSPRTLRNWLGDRVLQRAVGVVLGTTVFCLLGLRSARQLGDDLSIVPSTTVLVGVVLAIVSLVYVVRAIDQVTTNLQIGTIARRLTDDTIATIRSVGASTDERPGHVPAAHPRPPTAIPDGAVAVECDTSGWVQQIDIEQLVETLPEGATVWVVVVHGGFAIARSPLAWVDLPSTDDTDETVQTGDTVQADDDSGAPDQEAVIESIRSCFALGPSRTMQQDVGFGTSQLTDIAVRALSPGINDPQTARDLIMHLGEILAELWAGEPADTEIRADGRLIIRSVASPEEHLRAALDPIRHYGRHDPAVMRTMADMLQTLRSEIVRRELPNPVDPIDRWIDELVAAVDDDGWTDRERSDFAAAARRSPDGAR